MNEILSLTSRFYLSITWLFSYNENLHKVSLNLKFLGLTFK